MLLGKWILFSAFISVFSVVETADAFIFLKGSTYQKGERPVSQAPIWPTRTATFFVNTNLSIMGGSRPLPFTGAELLQSVEEAVNAWAAACRADLRVVVAGTTGSRFSSSDGANVILWDNRTTAEGNYYGTATSTLAAATTVLRGSEFADCDIVLNGNSSTTMKFTPAIGEADLRSVLTHEIGHCLGLDHPIEPPDYTSVDPFITGATMVQTAATGLDPSDSGRRDIAQDDRDGIECVYERGKPARTGLHCSSYTGTNGQGALTGTVSGGPTVTDTACGSDSQGRNALPSIESGDGCVTSAIAAPTNVKRESDSRSPIRFLGTSWGFLAAIGVFFILGKLRRIKIALFLILLASAGPKNSEAFELELTYGLKKISPTDWNQFSGMDPTATAWDRAPSAPELSTLSEFRVTAFTEKTSWGKWGGSFLFMPETSLESNAKAQGASEQSKKTSVGGVRIGPEVRWYPLGNEDRVRWFCGGRLGLGLFYGSQTFTSTANQGSLSYRGWGAELGINTGAEIPLGPLTLVVEGGYSRLRSSHLEATGNSGNAYTDFPSGTRIATNSASGMQELRFNGSGLYATLGLQITFGSDRSKPTDREQEPAPTPVPEASPAPTPVPEVSPVPAPEPSAAPLADPLEEERKFQDSIKPAPTPKPWEIDPIPSTFGNPTLPDLDAVTPNQADPVPMPNTGERVNP